MEASAGSVPLAEINRKTKESRFASSGASDAMIVFQYPFQGPAGSVPSGVCAYHCLSSGFDLRMERLPPSRPPSPRGPMPCGIEGTGRAHSRNGGGGQMRRIGCGAPKGAARGGGAFLNKLCPRLRREPLKDTIKQNKKPFVQFSARRAFALARKIKQKPLFCIIVKVQKPLCP